ncbi:MAG: hypothetical protein NNA23_03535 [Nitrospira sp.]|nr:hypothetical protein [Nitrospira sp.]MCP9463394.1 hypothetical protein [Nitrospira sp.]
MSKEKTAIVFATLAMNQTLFFEAVGEALEDVGWRVAFLCFHERSHEYLTMRGKRSFNMFDFHTERREGVDLSIYKWPSLRFILSHEMAAFESYDSARLEAKLCSYLKACETVLEELCAETSTEVIVVQELGGFLSNVACFYVARRRGIDNFFVEPSFFRGRVFFVRNGFGACRVPGPFSQVIRPEVTQYLADTIARQRAVIPVKDMRHYRGPFEKLTDAHNLRRLIEKFVDKHLLGKQEEFSHLSGHVMRHLRMWRNAQEFSRYYHPIPHPGQRFVYYPLHVPADVALTFRSPQYLDQYTLIDYLARSLPAGYLLLIKEHPALIGAADRRRMRELLVRCDNVRLLDPRINNYEVLSRADAVVTVNSKSGAEALLLGRPVIVLGDAFYTDCALVRKLDSLLALPEILREILNAPPQLDPFNIHRYFQDVWEVSYPGELYDVSKDNVLLFAQSLRSVVSVS